MINDHILSYTILPIFSYAFLTTYLFLIKPIMASFMPLVHIQKMCQRLTYLHFAYYRSYDLGR